MMTTRRTARQDIRMLAVVVFVVVLGSCADPPEAPSAVESVRPTASETQPPDATPSRTGAETPSVTPTPSADAPPVVIAAGDIAACDVETDSATAALVADLIDGTLLTVGDHVYPAATDETLSRCYDPVWGQFLESTHPAPGNHDLQEDGGAAYFRYFGNRAGMPREGWYSFDIGEWHVVVLNSNCELIACGPGSPQHGWLTHDLAQTDARCVAAAMHHPRFSSGPHGDYAPVAPLWEALESADADVLLVGHDHLYERFAPLNNARQATAEGIRQFTVGTGGYHLYAAEGVSANSEVLIDDSLGVLVLRLHADAYDWSFVTVGRAEADAGHGECH